MLMNVTLNKRAWNIRRKAAAKFNCGVLEISWALCLKEAKKPTKRARKRIKKLVDDSSSFVPTKRAGKRIKKSPFTPPKSEFPSTGKPQMRPYAKRSGRRIDNLKSKCIKEIERVVQFFSAMHDVEIPMPEVIDFKKRGKAAGTCWSNRISLNWELLKQERENFIRRTPGHEAVHYCEYFLFGSTSHGKRWKKMMVGAGLDAKRCHTYNTDNVGVKKPFTYYCSCRNYQFSHIQHQRAQNRGYYWCNKCKSELVWEGA